MHPVIATPIALFLPSRFAQVDAAKLALLGLATTVFFLFTSVYYLPGGASHFIVYADAVLHGTTLPPVIAQRDIGYPLLLLSSGFFVWNSILGITLIQAAFAILMPILIYFSLVRVSPTAAYYTGIFSILSLAPIYFLKWIHHDQTYVFFMILAVAMLASFLQSRNHAFLYYFTLAALGASFSRPAGNLLFPAVLLIAYVTVRGRIAHYLACICIFVVVTAGYQWHRYQTFDIRHQASTPSYVGQQIFYDIYVNSGDFGIRLSPDLGPNLQRITEMLRQKLQPSVRDSEFMKPALIEYPADFAKTHILPFTPDELVDRIYTAPNFEYYMLLASADPNDQSYLHASWEIARAHPFYVVRYVMRNLLHFLFEPGYAHTRYNVNRFSPVGLQFMPAAGGVVATGFQPADREMLYAALGAEPLAVQNAFAAIKDFWTNHYYDVVTFTSVLMVVAWLCVLLRWVCLVRPQTALRQAFGFPSIDSITGSTIAASLFLGYNALVTAAFAEPDYRYFHFTELLRLMISGFAVTFVIGAVLSSGHRFGRAWKSSRAFATAKQFITLIQDSDAAGRYFGARPVTLAVLLVIVTIALFGWWVSFMIARTW